MSIGLSIGIAFGVVILLFVVVLRPRQKEPEEGAIRIRLTGSDETDEIAAFEAMQIFDASERNEILKEYTWHYLDDLDENLMCTMQLVESEVLEANKPFVDSRDVFEKISGITYKRKTDTNKA